MKLRKNIRLIWTFYKTFLLVSLLVTASCFGLFWEYGLSIFAILFWFKVTTLGIIYYFINNYKIREYYYYQNLGVSRIILWSATITFDIFLFLLFIFQAYKLK